MSEDVKYPLFESGRISEGPEEGRWYVKVYAHPDLHPVVKIVADEQASIELLAATREGVRSMLSGRN